MPDDPSYYAERAAEERRLAMASSDLKVRGIHLEMAGKYAARAENTELRAELGSGDREKTA